MLSLLFFVGAFAAVCLAVGGAIGAICKRRFGVDGKVAKFLQWANTVTWLLPVVGMTTSGATFAVGASQKARTLATIGLVLSCLNSAAAMMLTYGYKG